MASKRAHADGSVTPESSETPANGFVPLDQQPFTIEYLSHLGAQPKKSKKRRKNDDHSEARVEPDMTGSDKEVTYIIRPGTAWEAMKKYRNFVVGQFTFGVHDYVLINNGEEAPEDGVSEDGQANWVGCVLEVRASDSSHVYVRIFWLYRPEDLPKGRRPYHGKDELIASNRMDIIDAMTVAGKAEVVRWDEKDEDKVLEGLYWRQTFDYLTQELSSPRRQCICSGFSNPDKLLIYCSNSACNLWLHEDCIVSDTLKRCYVMRPTEISPGKEKSPGKKKKGRKSTPAESEAPTEEWEGIFEGKLVSQDEGDEKTAKIVMITNLRETPPTTWEEDAICPNCRKKLN